jgi:2-keto-4-pentenoate hydratase/2-oxohepta-3-ene-1,7-dioic acid hydratase in catechol pathway
MAVPASEVPDPQRLAMKLWLDGELMQSSSTSEMIFGVAEQVSHLSSRVTLLPGDLVMTGTPAGTGLERDRFLQPGQAVRMSIERLGEMTVHLGSVSH